MEQGKQILIVEDDDDTRAALGAFLEIHGYSPVMAVNGADGLSKLRAGLRPSLILLDLMMPVKNGLQFRVEQVVDPMIADIPVIVYSGNLETYAHSAVLTGLTCLPKPIDVTKLLALLHERCQSDAEDSRGPTFLGQN